nr:MAG TPA: hypothetical protein [Caudoviricetes sp.]
MALWYKYSTIALKRSTSDFKGIVERLNICDFLSTFWRTEDNTTLTEHLCDFVREIQTTFQRLLNDFPATFKRLFSDFRLRPWKLFRLSKRLSKF